MVLDKVFNTAEVEKTVLKRWSEADAFKAGMGKKTEAEPFSIVLPPPNVTGSLHIGHAVNSTIQDILVRWKRMQGFDVLWQPGVDHAGIATQMVVERDLLASGKPNRQELGRDRFLEAVWAWKDLHGDIIIKQLQSLGISCDWSRERFTMDEGFSKSVAQVFVALYKRGLIYRDTRLVNWDPDLKTAISDLEVISTPVSGNLWHFKYYIQESDGDSITVSTTRPETMLGDTGIAVNPQDERYKDLIGKQAILPLVGRRLPIVADDSVDILKGYGALKVTPGHDHNDFVIGKTHGLDVISIFDREAKVCIEGNTTFFKGIEGNASQDEECFDISEYSLSRDNLASYFHGLDRFEAREKVIGLMRQRGLFVGCESILHTVPHGDRSNAVIEPLLTEQWYINTKELAGPAIDAVVNGKTRFVPKGWEKDYRRWMDNIQPWCVSRQLWWGHQIPAWYCKQEENCEEMVFVEETEEKASLAAEQYYGKKVVLRRDEDVLDTWFSSGLWPFVTLGWPDCPPEFQRYYPTSVLVTGFDIVFFWIARMMMLGIEMLDGQVPFKEVYVHALVRDAKGAKMSKSKGNTIDPSQIIDQHGADALRFAIAIAASYGKSIRLSLEHIVGYRGFATKLWNSARFLEVNSCVTRPDFDVNTVVEPINRWVLARLSRVILEVNSCLTAYRFDNAASYVYRFVWNRFCDWYLELAKSVFRTGTPDQMYETKATSAYVFDQVLKLVHPFMPFVTEELWEKIGLTSGTPREVLLALTAWPDLDYSCDDSHANVEGLIALISDIRSVRKELSVPAGSLIPLTATGVDAAVKEWLIANEDLIKRLARISEISFSCKAPETVLGQISLGKGIVFLSLGEKTSDPSSERMLLEAEKTSLENELSRIEGKLSNAGFMTKAKPSVVAEVQNKRERCLERWQVVKEAIEKLDA